VSAEVAKQDIAKLTESVITIERFSKEYFDLVKKNSKDANAALAQQREGEELYLEVDGKPVVVR
jgi:hypothetical protein